MKRFERVQFGDIYLGTKKYNLDIITEEVRSLPELTETNQLHLQKIPGTNIDPHMLYHDIKKLPEYANIELTESNWTEPTFNIPYINNIIAELGMSRSRLMKLPPKTCLTWHRDKRRRIHLPVLTNWRCLIVIEDKAIHLPADGNVYYTDTTKFHTVVNGTDDLNRLHIIGSIGPPVLQEKSNVLN